MNSRERLMNCLQGKPVDRMPVCFYEIDGFLQSRDSTDPYNIFSHPSWWPLLDLAREKSDSIVRMRVPFQNAPADPLAELSSSETWEEDGSKYTRTSIRAGSRVLSCLTRRDIDVDTVWTLEHLLKDIDDLKAFLELPVAEFGGQPDLSGFLAMEERVGEAGIVMVDTSDPICAAASMFDMAEYTVIAMTEPELFHRLLERYAQIMLPKTEAVARALPGRLWRICGSEYASVPYLPPSFYREYVMKYTGQMIDAINEYGGYPRLHSHGNLKDILPDIVDCGCKGLDPVEPPPQGDVSLRYVRDFVGEEMVLFGNLEASDLENLETVEFEQKIMMALEEGPNSAGGAFVLMPSACPYGRELSKLSIANYEKMVQAVERF